MRLLLRRRGGRTRHADRRTGRRHSAAFHPLSQKEHPQDQHDADHRKLQVEKNDLGPEKEYRQRKGDRKDNPLDVPQAGKVDVANPEQEDKTASDQDNRGPADQVDMDPGRGIETAQQIDVRALGRLVPFGQGCPDRGGQPRGLRMAAELAFFGAPPFRNLTQKRVRRKDQLHVAAADHRLSQQVGELELMLAAGDQIPDRNERRLGLGGLGKRNPKNPLIGEIIKRNRHAVDTDRHLPGVRPRRQLKGKDRLISADAAADPFEIGVPSQKSLSPDILGGQSAGRPRVLIDHRAQRKPLRQGRTREGEITDSSLLRGVRLFPAVLLVGDMEREFRRGGRLGAARFSVRGNGNRQGNVQNIRLIGADRRQFDSGAEFETDIADQTGSGKADGPACDIDSAGSLFGGQDVGGDRFAVKENFGIGQGRHLLRHGEVERLNRDVLDVVLEDLNQFGGRSVEPDRQRRVDRDFPRVENKARREEGRFPFGNPFPLNLIDKRRLLALGQFNRRTAARRLLRRQPFQKSRERNQFNVVIGNDRQSRRGNPVGRKFGYFEFDRPPLTVQIADRFPRKGEITLDLFFQGDDRLARLGIGTGFGLIDSASVVEIGKKPPGVLDPDLAQGSAVGGIRHTRLHPHILSADQNLVFRLRDQPRLPRDRIRLERKRLFVKTEPRALIAPFGRIGLTDIAHPVAGNEPGKDFFVIGKADDDLAGLFLRPFEVEAGAFPFVLFHARDERRQPQNERIDIPRNRNLERRGRADVAGGNLAIRRLGDVPPAGRNVHVLHIGTRPLRKLDPQKPVRHILTSAEDPDRQTDIVFNPVPRRIQVDYGVFDSIGDRKRRLVLYRGTPADRRRRTASVKPEDAQFRRVFADMDRR